MCWRSLFFIKLQAFRCIPVNIAQSMFTPIVQWSYFYTKLLNKSVRKMSIERNIYTEKLRTPQIPNLCNACGSYTMIVGKAYYTGKMRECKTLPIAD